MTPGAEARTPPVTAFLLGSSPISWVSKKQQSVATSTTEAKYMALSLTARQAIWYQHAFQQLRLDPIQIRLLADNQSGIKLVQNPVHHQRSKHIVIHYHFAREHLLARHFSLDFITTGNNIADIMTKGLTKESHEKFVRIVLQTD